MISNTSSNLQNIILIDDGSWESQWVGIWALEDIIILKSKNNTGKLSLRDTVTIA